MCVNVAGGDESVFRGQEVTQTRGRGYAIVVNFDIPESHRSCQSGGSIQACGGVHAKMPFFCR